MVDSVSERVQDVAASILIALALGGAGDASADGFLGAGSMRDGRYNHSATRLQSGKVLVVGGEGNSSPIHLRSAEIYDPDFNSWSDAAPMPTARYSHTATLLPSGKVLIAGGFNAGFIQTSALVYDPLADTWTPAGFSTSRDGIYSATLLPAGDVLVVGNRDVAQWELYEPDANTWTAMGSIPFGGGVGAAIPIGSGSVLSIGPSRGGIYDPFANTWEVTNPRVEQTWDFAMSALQSGDVMLAGGSLSSSRVTNKAEIYDVTSGEWVQVAPLAVARSVTTATTTRSGKIIVVGGYSPDSTWGRLASAELYDPEGNSWRNAGAMTTPRYRHTATLLDNGKVLIAGGSGQWESVSQAELYDPTSSTSIASVAPAMTVTGESYSVEVHVGSMTGVPEGSVVAADDAGAHCGPVVLVAGAGTCSLVSMVAGNRVLTATYLPVGDAFEASNAVVHHAVGRASTELVIASHEPDPSTPGQEVIVAANLVVDAPGAGLPTGPIIIGDGVDSCSVPEGSANCTIALTVRGPRSLTASYAGDGNFHPSSAKVTHNVNRLPVLPGRSYAAIEDGSMSVVVTQGVLAKASDPDGDELTITNAGAVVASGIGGMVLLRADGSFDYTPPADANGAAGFEYVVSDGLEEVAAIATITVEALNDAPTFVLAGVPAWPAGESGAKLQPGFASVSAFGPPDEAGQQVQAWSVRTIADPSGIASSVAISNDGTLSYTLSGNAGSATFGVTLQDDGGTANGGDDTSVEQAFTITVAAGLDLSIAIDDDRDFAQGGGTVEYTIVVHNAGPNAAVGARVRNLLPFNLVDASWACTPDAGASCTAEGTGDIDDNVTIPMGATLTYLLGATVLAEPESPIENSVSVIAPDGVPDADGTNNSATDVDTVGIFADGFGGGDATLH